jgi:hypothetical protein
VRFDEFVLHVPGDEFRLRFHPQLTVLAGVGTEERSALLAAMVGALTGESDESTILTTTDHTGRPVELRSTRNRVTARYTDDDGGSAPAPVGWLAPDATTLRSLVVISADDLGLGLDSAGRDDDPPELADARATLRQLEDERRDAEETKARADAALHRIEAIDEQLRRAEADTARRAYASALQALERVRSEAAALDSGLEGIEADRGVLAEAEGLHRLARQWVDAADAADAARAQAIGEPVDPAEVAWLAEVPAEVPPELQALLREASIAEARVRELDDRLRDLATATMPEPDDPRVLTLATADPRELWNAAQLLAEARRAVDAEQIRIGGLGPQTTLAAEIEELEQAHQRLEEAEAVVSDRRVKVGGGATVVVVVALCAASTYPVLAVLLLLAACGGTAHFLGRPMLERAAAAREEFAALVPLDAPSYLAFQLRRVDATIDPTGRDRLELAQAELSLAERAWAAVAGEVELAAAMELEADVRAYAEALRHQHGAIEALADLRDQLDTEAVPARDVARKLLLAALDPFGVTGGEVDGVGADVVAAVVAARVELGERARRQLAVIDAETDETKAADLLGEVLTRLGYPEGPLEPRFEAAGRAIEQAAAREAVRAGARSRALIDADLDRLEAEVRRLRRPEFATLEVSDVEDIDVDALAAERHGLNLSLADADRAAAHLDRITDRVSAVQRRVAALATQAIGDRGADDTDLRQIQNALLAHLTRAAKAGPLAEPVPVLLDDPLARVPADRKYELMDMLRRLAERTQLLYMTDDAFVGAWARGRAQADDDSILLLEPVE